MTDLAPHLQRLGLEQYLDAFIGEGFDTWETVTDIQESDFDALNVKLGHRRKLQRAIAEYRGISYERFVGSPAQEGLPDGGRAPESNATPPTGPERSSGPAPETKRKYRRHPKPDENAPERPPSAYVIFSNKVREEVKDQNLSFTQIAKLVGDRWQKLDPSGKEPFEAQASAAKERYNIQLSTYRKTDAYKEYMQYLSDFKAKHGQTSEPKRPKLDPESSGSIVSAKSLETNHEAVSQLSGHVRGGSMGSVVSSPFAGVPPQPNTSTSTVQPRPALSSSRSGSPPSVHHGRDYFRPGLVSSHSSVSDESSTVRSELPESLMRTSALSLGATSSGTPPLPALAPSAASTESQGSPDLIARSRLAYFVQQQQLPSAAGSAQSLPGAAFPPTLPSPTMQEPSWRNRPPDVRGYQETPRAPYSSLPFSSPSTQQSSPSQLRPLLSPDRLADFGQGPSSRTLPPPRTPSTGTPTLPHLGRSMEQPRPLITEALQIRRSGRDEAQSALDRSESDAANTLAGLAAGVSRPETAKALNYAPPRSSL
ncbi:uncharacterized protein Z518_04911 [Rhinocladiella mackenziei CBS 650.93]|uniref:Rhinocladiella mackenziei CBS 650.93 unplaced genomic scaffold supercont1.3, whole genome shotgun sequence n=1 Tax=Rhinocladiella mackenziei CBS 650.93 TaxID=1442369 RepID=A0A0D2JCT7_9EURO|nr:uncharacterized protein Z518_04911 [Rhinocladiella mackenziei CBS 650.93]KIX06935.1 hypothetical protein Z518_04911 [Rhinocladiella mackenziei CBS 650.93]